MDNILNEKGALNNATLCFEHGRVFKAVLGNYTCFRSGEFLHMRLCCAHNMFKECACGQHTRFFVFEMSQSAQNALSAVELMQ